MGHTARCLLGVPAFFHSLRLTHHEIEFNVRKYPGSRHFWLSPLSSPSTIRSLVSAATPAAALAYRSRSPLQGACPRETQAGPLRQHLRGPTSRAGTALSRATCPHHLPQASGLLCFLIPPLLPSVPARQGLRPARRLPKTLTPHPKRPLWPLPPQTQPCRALAADKHAPRCSGHPAPAGAGGCREPV